MTDLGKLDIEATIATLRKRIPLWLLPLLVISVVAIALYARSDHTAKDAELAEILAELADPIIGPQLERFLAIQSFALNDFTPQEQRRLDKVKAHGSTFEHWKAVTITALQLIDKYRNEDSGMPVTVVGAQDAVVYGGHRFLRTDQWPYRMIWFLRAANFPSGTPVFCWFIVEDHTDRCTRDLVDAADFEWSRYALFLDANGAPGLLQGGINASIKAQSLWHESKDHPPPTDGSCPMYSTTETAGDYTITVRIADCPGSDDGTTQPFGGVRFRLKYQPP